MVPPWPPALSRCTGKNPGLESIEKQVLERGVELTEAQRWQGTCSQLGEQLVCSLNAVAFQNPGSRGVSLLPHWGRSLPNVYVYSGFLDR